MSLALATVVTAGESPATDYATDPSFGPAVRNYLLENPEVILEVFSILEGHAAKTMIVSGHIHRPWSEERGDISLRAVTALARDLRKGDALAEMATDGFFVLYEVSEAGEISSELRQVPIPD